MTDHVTHLRSVLEVLRGNKLYAKMSKCSFAQSEIEYLGHIISMDGVATDPQKIEHHQAMAFTYHNHSTQSIFRINWVL